MTTMQIGTIYPEDAFEEITTGSCVTGQRIIVDAGVDKEVVVLDARCGASSTAPANSGVPSAMTQCAVHGVDDRVIETAMANHLQQQRPNLTP